jgi:hypothetical protein
MTAQPPSATPLAWSNQDVVLYHGTLDLHANSIVQNRVWPPAANPSIRPDVDFGAGFYTTTLLRQAEAWAYVKVAEAAATHQPANPGVVEFTVSRDSLAALDAIWFVRGDFDANDFWSLVFHCRSGQSAHGRPTSIKNGWYDVVVGPVAAFWRQRVTLQGYDQVSFHTDDAVKVLNAAGPRRVL